MFHPYLEIRSHFEHGRSSLAYVLSAGGLLDLAIAILFFVAQWMRFHERPADPRGYLSFGSYSQFAHRSDQLNMLEALVLLLLLMRMASFMAFFPSIYRFCQTFVKSLHMFVFYFTIVLPVFWGTLFLGRSIYSQHVNSFKSWADGASTLILALTESFDVDSLYVKNGAWTMAYLAYLFLCFVAFLMNGFLAIVVHIYFDTELVDTPDPANEGWPFERWLEWMLWTPVFKRILGGGGSGDGDDIEGEIEEEDSSSEEEGESKRR